MPHDGLWDIELREELMDEFDYDNYIHMKILEAEVGVLRSRFQEHDTGNLRTAVNVLENRIKELQNV